jgi:galactokinase
VNSRKHEVAALDFPKGVTVVGIDCGFKHPDAVGKYVRARAAAFMGKAFIEAALAARRGDAAPWDGALSSISVKDYVGFLRDRIPTRIKGSDFREKFKKSFDPLTEVDSDLMYKVRSRTEHHIYEADRVFKFAGHLGRARRTGDRSALQEAGKEMLASHWSYGQRCGLGSIPTDTLVSLLREREEEGIYGAKVSAQGAGGVVVVLMEDTERARSALRDALARYERGQARQTAMFEGGTDGALHYGVRQFESLDCPKP